MDDKDTKAFQDALNAVTHITGVKQDGTETEVPLKKRYHDDSAVYVYKANLLWSGFDTNARAGCRLGLFPYPELMAAEKEGYESQKLCTAIMRLARAS